MNDKSMMKHKAIAGFTLIEILIALTLFSVTLVLVFSGLHTTNRSWLASERQIETNEAQRLVMAFIKRQLGQTVPLLQLDGKKNYLVFKGDQHSIQFVSNLPAHRGGGGLYLLSLQADPDLTLRYQQVTNDIALTAELDNEKIQSQTLIADINSIAFSYYGSEKMGDVATWHNQWENKKRLPVLVRMQITSHESSTYWPEILVSIRTQTVRGQPQLTLQNKKIASSG